MSDPVTTSVVDKVEAEVKAVAGEAEAAYAKVKTEVDGFFSSIILKIRAEVQAALTATAGTTAEAEQFEKEVQARIDAFVAGVKAKLQELHTKL